MTAWISDTDDFFGGDYAKAAERLRTAGFTVSPVFGTFGREITAHDGVGKTTIPTTPEAVDAFLARGA
jgi:hypothetical protein